ncbi:TetR/AcrR family transcriptional regulator [Cellulosimicrobium funkei]|nr:TetR/AcrR family transcriptional regulator [Cellulosimicrobium funkei]
MAHDPVPDLRARRRLETQSLIHRAAVDLFEKQGSRGTTVEEIAARAGVSPRTFFRHFAAKEHAALPGVPRLERAIDALELAGDTPSAALRAVESMLLAVVAREPLDELRENRRLRRIIASEPEISGLAVAQDQEIARRLRQRLLELGGPEGAIDEQAAHLVAAVAMAVWRSGWDLWAAENGDGDSSDPVAAHRGAWTAVRGLLE